MFGKKLNLKMPATVSRFLAIMATKQLVQKVKATKLAQLLKPKQKLKQRLKLKLKLKLKLYRLTLKFR